MKDSALEGVKNFLSPRICRTRPLLIGYSGGPDSKALLYLLLESRLIQPLQLHVAHVDHGWRKESSEEAKRLEHEIEELGLPWHLKTLSFSEFSPGNLEEQARKKRLGFFSLLYQELQAQALLLGHHADDQAEVVLKRVFEGASLFSLKGIEQESEVEGMTLWRPLLCIPKKKLVSWISRKKISYLVDPTNDSPEFLRGRMRQKILPFLSNAFGKQIGENLCFLGKEAQQLKEFFACLNQPILETVVYEEEGGKLDLAPYLSLPLFQIKYLVKECLDRLNARVSRQMLDEIAKGLQEGSGSRQFFTKNAKILVKKRSISVIVN